MLHDLLLTFYYVALGVTVLSLCIYLWLFLHITLHECAHALVGKLVGFRPYALFIGKGRRLFRKKIGGIELVVHLVPLGGLTLIHRPRYNDLWWRGALFSIAGLAADVFLLLCLLQLKGQHDIEQMNGGFLKFLYSLLVPLAVGHAAGIAFNLYPHNAKVYGRVFPNDAHQFLRYITGRTQKALTEEYVRTVRCDDPQFTPENSWFIKTNHGSLAILDDIERDKAKGEFEAAAEKYLNLLSIPGMAAGERAMILDGLACLGLVQGDLSLRERSIQWAKDAYELLPKAVTLHGTYGAALIESGEYQRGIDFLTPLTTEGNAVHDIEISSSYLAKAYACLGDQEQAQAWLQRGRKSGAFLELNSRIEKEIAESDAAAH